MPKLTVLLRQLQQEQSRLTAQLSRLNDAIAALHGVGRNHSRGISAAGRARIAAAQRARWAKVKGAKVVLINSRKRRMSRAAIAKIRAAQKARWAKWRKAQKAG